MWNFIFITFKVCLKPLFISHIFIIYLSIVFLLTRAAYIIKIWVFTSIINYFSRSTSRSWACLSHCFFLLFSCANIDSNSFFNFLRSSYICSRNCIRRLFSWLLFSCLLFIFWRFLHLHIRCLSWYCSWRIVGLFFSLSTLAFTPFGIPFLLFIPILFNLCLAVLAHPLHFLLI